MRISTLIAFRPGTLCVLGLLAGLVLAGCREERSSGARPEAEVSPVDASTPVLLPVPTFTASPSPTGPPAGNDGSRGVLAPPAEGHYHVQRTGDQVTATLTVHRVPVPAGTSDRVLLTLPLAYRPSVALWRDVAGQVVQADGTPDLASPDPHPFRLWVMPEGQIIHARTEALSREGDLAYDLVLAWGRTPAANDQVVLKSLDPDLLLVQAPFVTLEDTGRVASLSLAGHRLQALPSELGQLTQLSRLDLSGNQLTDLPPELGQLTQLSSLDLGGNQLTELPPVLGQLTQLSWLDLYHNRFTDLPPVLVQLPNLHTLNLLWNEWTEFSPLLPQMTQLRSLSLSANRLTGPIPAALGQLTHLEDLDIRGGSMGELIGGGGSPEMYSGGNALSGPIPPELGQLTQLQRLFLGGNALSGPIPPELGQLTQLRQLLLGNNALSGPIPSELGQLPNLWRLDLSGNQLSGSIPPALGQMPRLAWLGLDRNQLTGPIPPALGQSASLSLVGLEGNPLTGCIPPELLARSEVHTDLSACPTPPVDQDVSKG